MGCGYKKFDMLVSYNNAELVTHGNRECLHQERPAMLS